MKKLSYAKIMLPILIGVIVLACALIRLGGSYDGITDNLFDIIHHKGAFYYGD